jgi:hypothetical protein
LNNNRGDLVNFDELALFTLSICIRFYLILSVHLLKFTNWQRLLFEERQ